VLAWLSRDLEKREWRRSYHVATGARLIALQAKKRARLLLLTNCDKGATKTVERKRLKPPSRTYKVRAPETQGFYNKYKCSVDLFNKMVLAYDHRANTNSPDVAVTQSLVHALTVQAFTYWVLCTGSDRSHYEFRLDLLRHFAPPSSPVAPPVEARSQLLHLPIKAPNGPGRCVQRPCTNQHALYLCARCSVYLCVKHFEAFHS